jgi:hypothetical protein
MALLTIQQIQLGLDKKFRSLEPMLSGFRLEEGGSLESEVSQCETFFKTTFPNDFRNLIKQFDFGKFTVGPIVFCNNGEYLNEVITLNTSIVWWGVGPRPKNFLMIANSDPYSVLLALDTGAVWVMDKESDYEQATCVANSFELYLRGVGTVMLQRGEFSNKDQLAGMVLMSVGGLGLGYWEYLAK